MEIASLQRRAGATLIDAAAFLTPTLLASGGGVALYRWHRRRRPGAEDADAPDPWDDDRWAGAFRRFGESRRWQFVLEAASLPIEIRLRNWRSPGMRALGLRRADTRTGGPVTVRSTLIRKAVVLTARELNRIQRRSFDERFRERHRLMKADIDEARRIHAEDREARERAMKEVVKRYGVTPWTACGRALLGVAPMYLPALWSGRNQTLPDRVAGILVVRELGSVGA